MSSSVDSSDIDITDDESTRNIENEENIVKNLLPAKSSLKYTNCYEEFCKWMENNKVKSISEDVLLVYFNEVAKTLNPTTLWSRWPMLKSVMDLHKGINIDQYKRLKQFLKNKSKGFEPKKSKIFSLGEVKKFIETAPDNIYLAMTVIAIFGVSGVLRTVELCNLKTTDIEDTGSKFVVTIADTKNYYPRSFVIGDEFYKKVQGYMAIRPNDTTTDRFFLFYHHGKCTKQVIGKNKFSEVPKTMAIFLQLENPERYTGHSFRRTSATLLANSGATLTMIKNHGCWRSSSVAEGYIENSLGNKMRIFERIVDAEKPSTSTGIYNTFISVQTPSSTFKELPETLENSHLNQKSVTIIPLDSINVVDLSPIVLDDETQNDLHPAGSPERDTQPTIVELPYNCPLTSAQDCNKTIVIESIENIDSVFVEKTSPRSA
ncbi:uncharacterized protein LOC123272797 [Cotesia glomerata]|uniref:uncharacterized protein LOC123272797 n=1 Tax=Cotesia glomerata TaxID=32391 RepID=UPI001D034ED6|nr:uncharacterized protein LOC123272797 [Cotesia glomerata]